MAKKEKDNQKYYNGLPVDSEEEVLTIMWLEELMVTGHILKIERAESFELSAPVTTRYSEIKQLKNSSKEIEKEQSLLRGHIYTPEFKVTLSKEGFKLLSWRPFTTVYGQYSEKNRKCESTFIGYLDNGDTEVVYIEVKPSWDKNNMTRLFTINQKWLQHKLGIFVNLIQPEKLCEKTFTPKAWLTTKTGKARVIHWDIRSLEDYLTTKNKSNEFRKSDPGTQGSLWHDSAGDVR